MTNDNEGTVAGLAATLSLNGVEPGRFLTPGEVEDMRIEAVRRMVQGIPFISLNEADYGVSVTIHVGNPVFRLLYEHVGMYPPVGYDGDPVAAECPDPDGGWFDYGMGDEYPTGVLADDLNAKSNDISVEFSADLRDVPDWTIDGENHDLVRGIDSAFDFIVKVVPFDFAE